MTLRVTLTHQFEHQQGETWSLGFSPDGKRLASSDGYALHLWQLDMRGNWNLERSLLSRHAKFLCFAPHSHLIAFRDHENFLRLVSLEDGKERAVLSCSALTDCRFSPDQRWLVTGDTTRNILLWDLLTYQETLIPVRFPRFKGDPWEQETALADETIRNFRLTPDGQRLVFLASSEEGDLHICHFDPMDKGLMRQKTFPHGCIDLAISLNGKMLAIIVPNGQIYDYREEVYIYDLESLRLLHVFPQTTNKRYCLLTFSPDSRFLMSCKSDGMVDIFSLDSFDCVAQFAAHPGLSSHATDPIGGLDWSATGYIATGGASVFEKDMDKTDYTIKIWKVEEE